MLNYFYLKTFLICQFFNFIVYFYILVFFFIKNNESFSFTFSKKKTIFFFKTSVWFLAFLPVSVGFLYKLFIFISCNFINLFLFITTLIVNTMLVISYFFLSKFFFFKKKNNYFLKKNYSVHTFLSVSLLTTPILVVLINMFKIFKFNWGLMLAINQRLLNEVTHARVFIFF